MNHPDDGRDRELSRLIADAVSDVEPTDRLAELRHRTARRHRRTWLFTTGGAVVAAAAVITAVALASGDQTPTTDPGPATSPSQATSPSPSIPPSATASPTQGLKAVPAYFVGDTPRGPRLYREFQAVPSPTPGEAGLGLLESGPLDPDYESLWPDGSFEGVSEPEKGVVHVQLGEAAPAEPSDLALQQVVYTVGAGYQERVAVVFHRGADVTDPVAAAPQLEVLSLVNLTDPIEGQTVQDVLAVKGVANSFEANVLWRLESDGDEVESGFFPADGWMGARLFEFSGEVDVSSLDPGTYTLIVETDDPSGGAEGPGAFSDSRAIVIE